MLINPSPFRGKVGMRSRALFKHLNIFFIQNIFFKIILYRSESKMEEKVIHEKENDRFVIYVESHEVYVEYTMRNNIIDLHHTYTHPALRGKGLAAHVVRAAFEFAKENNLKVIPTCSYVQAFINKNDEYTDFIA
jgi:predicted GNAT family acetyltransferase